MALCSICTCIVIFKADVHELHTLLPWRLEAQLNQICNTLVPITIATGITTYIIEGTGGDRGSLVCYR